MVRKENLLNLQTKMKKKLDEEKKRKEMIIFTQLHKTLMINSQNFIVSPNELNL